MQIDYLCSTAQLEDYRLADFELDLTSSTNVYSLFISLLICLLLDNRNMEKILHTSTYLLFHALETSFRRIEETEFRVRNYTVTDRGLIDYVESVTEERFFTHVLGKHFLQSVIDGRRMESLLQNLYSREKKDPYYVRKLKKSVLLVNLPLPDPCTCRSLSYCLHFDLNRTFEVYIAAATDRGMQVFRRDEGCFRPMDVTLEEDELKNFRPGNLFDVLFVFNVNYWQLPYIRTLEADKKVLLPYFELTEAQISNFFHFADYDVIRDELFIKIPNPTMISELRRRSTRRNYLLYVGNFWPRKGQYAFVERLNRLRRTSHGTTILFVGKVYNSLPKSLHPDFQLQFEIDRFSGQEMARIIREARGVIIWSSEDTNPRIAYEAYLAGVPLFLTSQSRVHPLLEKCSVVLPFLVKSSIFESSFLSFLEKPRFRRCPRFDKKIHSFHRKLMGQL